MSWWVFALAAWLVVEVGEGVYLHRLKRRCAALQAQVESLILRSGDTRR